MCQHTENTRSYISEKTGWTSKLQGSGAELEGQAQGNRPLSHRHGRVTCNHTSCFTGRKSSLSIGYETAKGISTVLVFPG